MWGLMGFKPGFDLVGEIVFSAASGNVQGLLGRGHGVGGVVELGVGEGQVLIGVEVIGTQPDRMLILADRLLILALGLIGQA